MNVDWERVLQEEAPPAWRTACRLLGNQQDAEDCLQDALADTVQISQRQVIRNYRALLQRLVTTRAMDQLRRRYCRRPANSQDHLESIKDRSLSPPLQAQGDELLERLRSALPSLPAQQSQAFVLNCIEGCSYQEVADLLGLSVGAVGMLVLRARERLKQMLGETCDVKR